MVFELTSSAIEPGKPIPRDFTGDGRDISPPLKWSDPPVGTASLLMICDDPDAPRGTFTHWIAFNLPSESRELSQAISNHERLPNGTIQIVNDFGKVGYGGPAPPPGKPHRYFFRLYALNRKLDLKPNATRSQVMEAMGASVIAEAELMGTYQR